MKISVNEPSSQIVSESVKIFREITSALSDIQLPMTSRPSNMYEFVHGADATLRRRIEESRDVITGLSDFQADLTSIKDQSSSSSKFSRASGVKTMQKLSPRILEAWLNQTLEDAIELDIPGIILKPENRTPLVRYGIDRPTLTSSGVPTEEIDRIYRALFVYSVGFYQLLSKSVEHSPKKFTIVTGIWKVFAILLEYCCQIDFQLMITKLDLEKNDELNRLKADFQFKIMRLEDQERQLIGSQDQIKLQLAQVQKELEKESFRRQEIEDEIASHGSGQEEEIKLRLQFEGKLNQMFARQRDMAHRLQKITEISKNQDMQLKDRVLLVNSQKELIVDLTSKNLALESESIFACSKIKEQKLVIDTMDKKLDSTLLQVEEVKQDLSTLKVSYQEKLTEIMRWKVEYEAIKGDRDFNRFEKYKNTEIIQSLTSEREGLMMRIEELNSLYIEAYQQQRGYRQEYHRLLELEKAAKEKIETLKVSLADHRSKLEETTSQRDKFKTEWESLTVTSEDYKTQLKHAIAKLDEAAEARRLIEDWNIEYEKKITSQKKELYEKIEKITKLNKQLDVAKSEISNLNDKLTALEVKSEHEFRMFKTRQDENSSKVKSLNLIIASEKTKREDWINKYEAEIERNQVLDMETNELKQKLINYESNKGNFSDKLNNLIENSKNQVKIINKQQEEIDVLNAKIEDSSRKMKSVYTLLEENDKEIQAKKLQFDVNSAVMAEEHNRDSDMIYMIVEDIRSQAALSCALLIDKNTQIQELDTANNQNLDTLHKLKQEITTLKTDYERSLMISEEQYSNIIQLNHKITSSHQENQNIKSEFDQFKKVYSKITLQIPYEFRGDPDPIAAMDRRITDLKGYITKLKEKALTDTQQTQTFIPTSEQIIQTDINSTYFDKISRGGVSSKRISEKDYTEEVYDSVNDMYDYIAKTSVNAKEDPKKNSEFETEFPLRNRRGNIKIISDNSLDRERYARNMTRIPDLESVMGKQSVKGQMFEFTEGVKPTVRIIPKIEAGSPASFKKMNNHTLSLPPDSRIESYSKMKIPSSNSSLDKSFQGTKRKQEESSFIPTERTMPISHRRRNPHEFSSDLSSEYLNSISNRKKPNHEDSADFATEASLHRVRRKRYYNEDSIEGLSNPSMNLKYSGDPLSLREEDLTPVNLSSMYLHDASDSATANPGDSDQHLPSIAKNRPHSPPDIRKYIKQANSRRKNDYNFL